MHCSACEGEFNPSAYAACAGLSMRMVHQWLDSSVRGQPWAEQRCSTRVRVGECVSYHKGHVLGSFTNLCTPQGHDGRTGRRLRQLR